MEQKKIIGYILLISGIMSLWFSDGHAKNHAFDLKSKYAVITYFDHQTLRQFNDKLNMGRFTAQIKKNMGDTLESEVAAKIDFIVEKVMTVLDMFPSKLKFSIQINSSKKKVQESFKRIYDVDVDYIAFYSQSVNRVFYSAGDISLPVATHEIGHVVAENYFIVSPPLRIHEIMAQFAEQHITD
jgi:ribosomal protein L23